MNQIPSSSDSADDSGDGASAGAGRASGRASARPHRRMREAPASAPEDKEAEDSTPRFQRPTLSGSSKNATNGMAAGAGGFGAGPAVVPRAPSAVPMAAPPAEPRPVRPASAFAPRSRPDIPPAPDDISTVAEPQASFVPDSAAARAFVLPQGEGADIRSPLSRFERQLERLAQALPTGVPRPSHGRLLRAVGTVLRAMLPDARMGELVRLEDAGSQVSLMAEVVGLDEQEAILAPIGDTRGLSTMAEVIRTGDVLRVPVGDELLGRVVDGLGRPLDVATAGPLQTRESRPVDGAPPDALERELVERPMPIGVRAIDGLLTVGEGQRMGIYGEPGGGKSTLLAQLVRGAEVDVVVVGLIGERGREVRDFMERQITPEARARTVLVVATSDRPAVERLKATYTATAIAESFRDRGMKVLLVIDSVTRFARALREIGLAAGEPPARRGFPPSVMAELPRLMERAGPAAHGSITAFYTVLVEGDGFNDPIAEETRGILDGHIILSPKLAGSGHYPAIDILVSRSRVMDAVTAPEQRAWARHVRDLMQRYQDIEFLVQVGEYKPGVDPKNDEALEKIEPIREFLRQATDERTEFPEMLHWLQTLSG